MKKILNSQLLRGGLAVGLTAILWSLDGVFFRPKFYQYPASTVVFLEHLFGFVLLFYFLYKNFNSVKSMNIQDWIALFWVCLFGGLLGTLFITKAFFAAFAGSVTFATVVILQKLQPIFALFMARIILKEKLKPIFYLWAGIALLSAYLIAFGKTGLNISSVQIWNSAAGFAVFAAFAFGSSTVFGKKIVTDIDFSTAAALRFGITTILAFIYILFSKEISAISTFGSVHWLLLVAISFSSGAVALFIYYFGLKRIPASYATLFELFWPLSAIILDYIINKNSLNFIQIFASLLLLFSLYKVLGVKTRSVR